MIRCELNPDTGTVHAWDDEGKMSPDQILERVADALNRHPLQERVRCNRGHETARALWNCPACTDPILKRVRELVNKRWVGETDMLQAFSGFIEEFKDRRVR